MQYCTAKNFPQNKELLQNSDLLGTKSCKLYTKNLYYCKVGNTILRLWCSVLAYATIQTKLFSNILKNKQRHEIKMEDVCKLHSQDIILNFQYGKTDTSTVEYILFKNSRLKTAVNTQQYSDP
jgi:hypothetical protein